MLIILEGPDGGGKSTLAKAFCASRGGDRHYISQLGGRTLSHEQMRINTYQLSNALRNGGFDDQKVLVERLHMISDEVYREVFGGKRFLSDFETGSLLHDFAQRLFVIVYCRPPVQEVINCGLEKAGDDTEEWLETVGQKLPDLFGAYDWMMNKLAFHYRIPVVRYDYTQRKTVLQVETMICAA